MFRHERKPECHKPIEFDDFVFKGQSAIMRGELPNHRNTNFATCGRDGGQWTTQFDRRVGKWGNVQFYLPATCC